MRFRIAPARYRAPNNAMARLQRDGRGGALPFALVPRGIRGRPARPLNPSGWGVCPRPRIVALWWSECRWRMPRGVGTGDGWP